MGKGKDNIVVSKELQIILEKINKSLENKESLTECGFNVKSLWMFRHVPQIRSFKSWGYLAIDKDVKKAYNDESYRLKERVSKQVIPEDIGSIGKAFKQEKENLDWLFVPNTYDAPEGTVVELDLRLGHQSVLFVPFKAKKDIVAILLISTATFEEKKKPDIQKIIKETFKNIGINELIQLAYWNERNKDVIANVKKATMNFVGTGTTPVNETMKDIISSEITTPEVFVRDHFISPIKEFNQGISFVPIIEIEDKHHLQKPLLGYSDVVYDKLKQRLSESIKSEDYKEGSNDDALVLKFTEKCKKSAKFSINLGQGCSITYVLKGNEDVGKEKEDMERDAVCFKEQADGLVNDFCEQCDPKTSLIIKKKYISEKLNQTYKEHGHTPFYLVLEKSVFSLGTVTLTFDKELIASNLNDKTFPLDDYREELIGENGFYNFTEKEAQSKLIDGLIFKVYTDKKRKKEEIFNEDVKAFIDQRCLYYKLLLDQKQAKKDAVRAAIAQVMARNMSHNFGSHVYSRLIDDKVYKDLKDYQVRRTLKSYTPLFANKEVFKRGEDHQLQFFFQYQKSRMDYLSEITFGVPNLMMTKMMYGDVMKELDRVRILLNHISGVSGFKYRFSLKYNNKSLKSNDIGVAFPNDVLGCHAFYNIIENIIRNTAKHAGNQSEKPITFTIHFKDIKGCDRVEGVDELYCVEIDNGVREDGIEELVKHQNERFNKSVLENNKLRSSSLGLLEMEASAAFLRQIDLPEIESDDYEVNLEKDVYFHELPNGKKLFNIIRAFAVAVRDEGAINENGESVKTGRLGYRFFVQKPKEFLFVGDWKICEQDDEQEKARPQPPHLLPRKKAIRRQLLNCGIQFLTEKEFCTAMQSEKAFAHQFLIYPKGVSEQVKEYLKDDNDCRTLLPLRKLSISIEDKPKIEGFWTGEENVTIIGKQVLQSLKEFAWNKYFEKVVINQMKNCQNRECNILGQINRENENNQVVFLDHGKFSTHDEAWRGSTKLDRTTGQPCILQGAKVITDKEIWIENLSSRTQGKLPLFNNYCHPQEEQVPQDGHQAVSQASPDEVTQYIKNISSKPQIIYEIFEAYHNKIVVIDERVQKFAMKNKEGSGNDEMIRSIDLHESTNVHIPRLPSQEEEESEDVFSLDPTDFSELKTKVVAYVNNRINDDNNKPIILIHYGVLERMCGGKVDEINKILKDWTGEEKAKRVVVTSGRGSHSLDLPKSVCFVNLSSVLYAFNENRNKYIINNLLNQSRRKRHE